MNHSLRWATIAAVTVSMILTSCASHPDRHVEIPPADPARETTTYIGVEIPLEGEPTMQETRAVLAAAEIVPTRGRYPSGRAELVFADDQAQIEVELLQRDEGALHAAALHEGDCRKPGSLVAPLQSFDDDEPPRSRTSLDPLLIVIGQPYAVVVHAEDSRPVACGELQREAEAEVD